MMFGDDFILRFCKLVLINSTEKSMIPVCPNFIANAHKGNTESTTFRLKKEVFCLFVCINKKSEMFVYNYYDMCKI